MASAVFWACCLLAVVTAKEVKSALAFLMQRCGLQMCLEQEYFLAARDRFNAALWRVGRSARPDCIESSSPLQCGPTLGVDAKASLTSISSVLGICIIFHERERRHCSCERIFHERELQLQFRHRNYSFSQAVFFTNLFSYYI